MFEAALASLRPRRRGSIAVSTGLHAALAGALLLPPMLRIPELGVEPPERVPPFVTLGPELPKRDEPKPPAPVPGAGRKINVRVVTAPTAIGDLPKPLKDGEKEPPEVIGPVAREAEVVDDEPPYTGPIGPPGPQVDVPVQATAPGVTPPVPLATPAPDYPELMRRVGIEGLVVLEAVIDREGHVTDVRVLRGVNPVLDRAASEAVLRWRYQAARIDGRSVAVYLSVTVNFRLNR